MIPEFQLWETALAKRRNWNLAGKTLRKKHGNSRNQSVSTANKEHHLPSSDFSNNINVSPPSRSGRQNMPESDLMSKFEQRLKPGQFRFLNQSLYSLTGSESRSLFEKNKTLFHEYHQGYIHSMKHWSSQSISQYDGLGRSQKASQSWTMAAEKPVYWNPICITYLPHSIPERRVM